MDTSILDLDAYILGHMTEFIHPIYRARLRSTCRHMRDQIKKPKIPPTASDLLDSGIEWNDLEICECAARMIKQPWPSKRLYIEFFGRLMELLPGPLTKENNAMCTFLINESIQLDSDSSLPWVIWLETISHLRHDLLCLKWLRSNPLAWLNVTISANTCLKKADKGLNHRVCATFSQIIKLYSQIDYPMRDYISPLFLADNIHLSTEICEFLHKIFIQYSQINDGIVYEASIEKLAQRYITHTMSIDDFIDHCRMVFRWMRTEGYTINLHVVQGGEFIGIMERALL